MYLSYTLTGDMVTSRVDHPRVRTLAGAKRAAATSTSRYLPDHRGETLVIEKDGHVAARATIRDGHVGRWTDHGYPRAAA